MRLSYKIEVVVNATGEKVNDSFDTVTNREFTKFVKLMVALSRAIVLSVREAEKEAHLLTFSLLIVTNPTKYGYVYISRAIVN